MAHGVNIKLGTLSPPSVETVDASTIFCLGTAPGADVGVYGDGTNILYNKPFLLTKRSDAPSDDLGTDGTLPKALDSIYAQGSATVAMVIVEEASDVAAVLADALTVAKFSNANTQSAVTALSGNDVRWAIISDSGKKYLAFKNITSADETKLAAYVVGQQISVEPDGGGSVIHTYTLKGTYDTTNDRIEINSDAAVTGVTDGTDYDLERIAATAVDGNAQTRANAIGDASEQTGIYAALGAKSVVGRQPRILCAPGLDTRSRPLNAANGLATAMVTVAERLKAIAIIDGPNTSHADAVTYIADFDSTRAVVVDPGVRIADEAGVVDQAASGFVAGLFAWNDARNGFWQSPSNKPLRNVLGTSRAIDYTAGDANSRAQLLNDNNIFTIINEGGGYRFWGNETPATTDAHLKFVNVQRTQDVLADSLQRSLLWAVDRGITKNFLSAVTQACNDFIRGLVALGALIGGECYPDADLNTPANIALGKVFFNIKYTPVYPAQEITLKINLTNEYLTSLAA
ncbi:phage tail sheath family protein [Candidatus Poribacteria bacterium]|nr:phage tail sheath family protein [Candidatus Poribacteria bacterium]